MEYISALQKCGLSVQILEADEEFPDSTFIEDVALLTKACAIIMKPGVNTRQGEIEGIKDVLSDYYDNIHEIKSPATIEAGDIMMVGDHFYVGLSERTNEAGAWQLRELLAPYQMTSSTIRLKEMLHLKTSLSYLESNNLLVCDEFLMNNEFQHFNLLEIAADEAYAANSIWVNGTVIVPEGYPASRLKIEACGYPTIAVDVSEFRKLDGGLSCLSLRF
jgi:dimethylargininase